MLSIKGNQGGGGGVRVGGVGAGELPVLPGGREGQPEEMLCQLPPEVDRAEGRALGCVEQSAPRGLIEALCGPDGEGRGRGPWAIPGSFSE